MPELGPKRHVRSPLVISPSKSAISSLARVSRAWRPAGQRNRRSRLWGLWSPCSSSQTYALSRAAVLRYLTSSGVGCGPLICELWCAREGGRYGSIGDAWATGSAVESQHPLLPAGLGGSPAWLRAGAGCGLRGGMLARQFVCCVRHVVGRHRHL